MEIMNQFAEAVGAGEVSSVPFIIVGNKYHEGSQSEDAFLSMVKNGKNSSFDVYFDKIK
jgi:predicted DsbA family dithiol-disulfide isomerase